MSTRLEVERVYPHPIERVWRALTEPELLAQWLMPNDFRPEIGHEFTFRTEPGPGFDGIVRCRVVELEPMRRLGITWAGGPIDTVVTFELSEVEGGTRFRMRQTGFAGMRGWLVSRMLKLGTRRMVGRQLPELLDSMRRGEERGSRGPRPAETQEASSPVETEPVACRGPWQRTIMGLLRLGRRRGQGPE